MPILLTDLSLKYSTNVSGNSQIDPNASLGGYVSTTIWSGGGLNDLFSDISGSENAALQVDYRCIFVCNNNSTLTFMTPVLWIASDVSGGAAIALGIDPTPCSLIIASTVQALSVANTLTAPAGVVFSSPISLATGLLLGSLPAGQCKAFWVQRTATNNGALNNDGFSLQISGDSAS
jgi:hypothetical protein